MLLMFSKGDYALGKLCPIRESLAPTLVSRELVSSCSKSIQFLSYFCAVNTFTEHRGSTWSEKDMQHT